MHNQMFEYVAKARDKGLSDAAIKSNLVLAGWEATLAEAVLTADLSMPAPAAPQAPVSSRFGNNSGSEPIAVVSNFTTRGLEYIIMFIALAVTAVSLGLVLHNLVDGLMGVANSSYEGVVSYSTSALVVGLPIFLLLFLRLKKAELGNRALVIDPSRKHAVQLTLIITFIIGIWKVISYIYSLLNAGNSSVTEYGTNPTLTGNLVHTLITLIIAGGIFAYYWRDSHKADSL